MLRILADESVDRQVVDRLRTEGHDVAYVAESAPGTDDDVVLDRANRDGAVLITADKDFGELVYRQGRAQSGVVLMRLAGLRPDRKAEIVASFIRARTAELERSFTVIAPTTARIRRPRR